MAVRFWHVRRATGVCNLGPKQMADDEKVEQTPDQPSTSYWWRVRFGLVTGGGDSLDWAMTSDTSYCEAWKTLIRG